MLPLFYEKAATPAMMKHGMDVLQQAINFLNPNQIPVITLPAIVCPGKDDSVDVARHLWRRQVHSYVWWPPHGDGPMEYCW